MGVGFGREAPEAEGTAGVADAGGILLRGEGEAGSSVLALQDQALAQDLVSLGVRRALEQRIDLEVWLGVGHWGMDPATVLEQEEISEEGGRMVAEAAFPVGGPDVFGVADGFLGAVVEVVAEARADLGFELDGEQELAVGDDEQVPLLFWPVVAGSSRAVRARMSSRESPAPTRTSVRSVSSAPIWVPPVTAPRVPASIFPASICFCCWRSRASQNVCTACRNRWSRSASTPRQ